MIHHLFTPFSLIMHFLKTFRKNYRLDQTEEKYGCSCNNKFSGPVVSVWMDAIKAYIGGRDQGITGYLFLLLQ